MKKLLIFALDFDDLGSPAAEAIRQICSRLDKNDYYLITNRLVKNQLSPERIGNVQVFRLGQNRFWDKYLYWLQALNLARRLNQNVRFDFAWAFNPSQTGLAVLFLNYLAKLKYLLTDQINMESKLLHQQLWWWEYFFKKSYRRAACIVAASRAIAKRIQTYRPKSEIFIVGQGIDFTALDLNSAPSRENIRQDLALTTSDTLLLALASGQPKDNEEIVRAINFLQFKSGLEVKLALVDCGAEQFRLETLAQNIGVDGQILFWESSNQAWQNILGAADIFLPLDTNQAQKIFLAIKAGIPILALNSSLKPDYLIDNESATLFGKINAGLIAQAVEKVISNNEQSKKQVAVANKLIKDKYTWESIASKMSQVFEQKMSL